MTTVHSLFVYPIKSARGISKASVSLGQTGFEWDRHWLTVNAKGFFLTQRTHPKLARIEPEITTHGLILRAPGLAPLHVPLTAEGARVPVRIWNDQCEALDQGEPASAWLSGVLGDKVRLIRMPPAMGRIANSQFTGPITAPVSFADGYPILVCNRASLDALNGMMAEPVPMDRFRPNIVLDGLPAFEEDRIRAVTIGNVTLRLVKPCARCVITSTDQRTGERSTDPLPVLRKFRFDRELPGAKFGENAVIETGIGATLHQGADCEVALEDQT
jgi:uncharacterized protein YcbX